VRLFVASRLRLKNGDHCAGRTLFCVRAAAMSKMGNLRPPRSAIQRSTRATRVFRRLGAFLLKRVAIGLTVPPIGAEG
jgi:hypothetical protein